MTGASNGGTSTESGRVSGSWPTSAAPRPARFDWPQEFRIDHLRREAYAGERAKHFRAERGVSWRKQAENLVVSRTVDHGDYMESPTREEIDAKIAATEARLEARVARIEASAEGMREANAEFRRDFKADLRSWDDRASHQLADFQKESRETRRLTIATGLGAVVAIAALIVALYQLQSSQIANLISSFGAGQQSSAPMVVNIPPPRSVPVAPPMPAEPTPPPEPPNQ